MGAVVGKIPATSLVAGLLFLGGCVGDGSGLPTEPEIPEEATFTSIARTIFAVRCTKCHAGANAPQGLMLDEANAHDFLVGVPSQDRPELLRVAPGNPDDSYIVIKIEGTDPRLVGRRMPFDGPPFLTAEQIANIRDWISSGAPRN